MNVYDRAALNYAVETLWTLAIGLLIVVVMDFTLRMMRSYFLDLASERIDRHASADIMERVLGSRLSIDPHRLAPMRSISVRSTRFETLLTLSQSPH